LHRGSGILLRPGLKARGYCLRRIFLRPALWDFWRIGPRVPGQKSGGPLTPKRPAFAFLVTPILPLGGSK
jgi:hypothetical protein